MKVLGPAARIIRRSVSLMLSTPVFMIRNAGTPPPPVEAEAEAARSGQEYSDPLKVRSAGATRCSRVALPFSPSSRPYVPSSGQSLGMRLPPCFSLLFTRWWTSTCCICVHALCQLAIHAAEQSKRSVLQRCLLRASSMSNCTRSSKPTRARECKRRWCSSASCIDMSGKETKLTGPARRSCSRCQARRKFRPSSGVAISNARHLASEHALLPGIAGRRGGSGRVPKSTCAERCPTGCG